MPCGCFSGCIVSFTRRKVVGEVHLGVSSNECTSNQAYDRPVTFGGLFFLQIDRLSSRHGPLCSFKAFFFLPSFDSSCSIRHVRTPGDRYIVFNSTCPNTRRPLNCFQFLVRYCLSRGITPPRIDVLLVTDSCPEGLYRR